MTIITCSLRRFVLLVSLILLTTAAGAEDCSIADPATFGPWAVGHMTFDAVDGNRGDRTLLTDVWYPVDPEDAVSSPLTLYPLGGGMGLTAEIAVDDLPVSSQTMRKLIVFSHGYGGTNTQSTPLMETLASHGFIVASPEHTGNTASDSSDTYTEASAKRVPDVSFIIDYMIDRSDDPADPFYQRIHPTEVGVTGHSFGGMTTIGMVAGLAGAAPDPRVVAIVPVSAVVIGIFTEEQLQSIAIPTLLMGGTEDTAVPIGNNEFAFNQIPGCEPVYRTDIIGAVHTHFANVCAIGDFLIGLGIIIDNWPIIGAEALVQPYMDTCMEGAFPIEEAIRLQNLFTVAHFKRHLQSESPYSFFLTENFADDVDGSDLSVFTNAFGSSLGEPDYNSGTDFNNDDTVDECDLAVIAPEFGRNEPEISFSAKTQDCGE